MTPPPNSPWPSVKYRHRARVIFLIIILLFGVATVGLIYPLSHSAFKRNLRQWWSARLIRCLGLKLRISGGSIASGSLIIANHISWLDIFVINATSPAAFISKSEIKDWPLIGWLAIKNETLFLRRGCGAHARAINEKIGTLLAKGRHVAIFPEGTTTDGSHVLNFHTALLQPAIETGAPIQPLAIAYRLPDGRPTSAPAYYGDITLLECIWATIAEPEIIVRVTVGTPLSAAHFSNRKELARHARDHIVAAITN